MWKIIYVLPNIEIEKPIENNCLAFVPIHDPRVNKIISSNSYAKSLIKGFKDKYKNEIKPSILIVNDQAPSFYLESETIFGFRNISAISMIIEGFEHKIKGIYSAFPIYSNYFDFYPLTVNKENDGFITLTPAVGELAVGPTFFEGQSNPSLSIFKDLWFGNNIYLFDLLKIFWERRFIKRKLSEYKTNILFRSLEIAYKATELPSIGSPTIYDFGTKASLWVSAFEILAHPRGELVNIDKVFELLGNFECKENKLKIKKYRKSKKHKKGINFIQNLYKYLYKIRNDFLHGNSIKESCLYIFGNVSNSFFISSVAPLLYKVALLQFIKQSQKRRRFNIEDYLKEINCKNQLEEALLELIDK
jgi:hypothetical protein